MNQKNEKVEEKPFHESIVDAINGLSGEIVAIYCLIDLIKHTKIPANHDAIILAWINKMDALGYGYFGVPEIVATKKPVDSKQVMDSAESLEKAIELAFDHIPLDKGHVGPKENLILFRNGVKKGHQDVAKVRVVGLKRKNGQILFVAHRDNDHNQYKISSFGGNKIEDWSDQW
ncbi:MAG: hypothetical protein ACYC40_01715 [Patescibacteria group bacterium]